MPSGTGLSHFAKAHPGRYFDVGIAEEHATLFVALLRKDCNRFAIYSTFSSVLRHGHIHDIAIQNLNGTVHGPRRLSGDDGPTHHGILFSISGICDTSQIGVYAAER